MTDAAQNLFTSALVCERIRLERIETYALEAPIDRPVRNSFRTLTARSSLMLRVTDTDGGHGWGEVWCNYPPGGARHRAALIERVAAPLLIGREFDSPGAVFRFLEESLRLPAITCGEPGPFAQITAGIDIAVWDLVARRAGEPLWRYLGGVPTLNVYASGISPGQVEELATRAVRNGHRAAKLKVGFGTIEDRTHVATLRSVLGDSGALMLDANQKWKLDEAAPAIGQLAEFKLEWIEEPMAADVPISAWQSLSRVSPVPIAAGENLRGTCQFDEFVRSGALRFLQPDMGKWGGYTECVPLGRRAIAAGLSFCPHWLGGGIGLLASLHLLGAVGAQGWGEVDANPNPLQQRLLPADFNVRAGTMTLTDAPGLGYDPEPAVLEEFRLKM